MPSQTTRLLVLLILVLVVVPLATSAQQPAQVPRIGYLTLRASPSELDEAFTQGLHELGWIAGQTIAIEYRWAAGQVDRLPALAAELVRLPVRLIVTSSTAESQAAKAATSSLPIVMTASADPVRTGLVASLARPGGNVTGMTGIAPELEGKRLELLRALLPRLSRVAYLAYGGDPAHRLFVKEAQEAAARLAIQMQPLILGNVEEMEGTFAALRDGQVEALMVQPLFAGNLGQGQRIADLALQHHVPTVSHAYQLTQLGGLMSYAPDNAAMARRAAVFVDKILKGAKPGDLPVEQPTKFRLMINLKTAKILGLDVPPLLLATADEVIE